MKKHPISILLIALGLLWFTACAAPSGNGVEPQQEIVSPAEPTAEATARNLSELRATDPSTVQLSSGQIQFVEFFAFW